MLGLRDLLDYAEFTLFERADAKGRQKIEREIRRAARIVEAQDAVRFAVPGAWLAQSSRVRRLAPPGPDGMAVGEVRVSG